MYMQYREVIVIGIAFDSSVGRQKAVIMKMSAEERK